MDEAGEGVAGSVLNQQACLDRDLGIGAIIPQRGDHVLGSFDTRPAQDLFVSGIAMDKDDVASSRLIVYRYPLAFIDRPQPGRPRSWLLANRDPILPIPQTMTWSVQSQSLNRRNGPNKALDTMRAAAQK